MSGRADSETHPAISGADDVEAARTEDHAEGGVDVGEDGALKDDGAEGEAEDPAEVARRARWTAAGAGALLTLAGLAAALLRLFRSASALVPAAYAAGAAVCAVATFIGSRGRTRRALWLLIAGVMVMALGDQLD
ncbi:hypothetical protein ACFYM5_19315 [Streptomyces sp. NPDC006706]|uniref:hypothetical protein n=1 Tax=Streptomyces sp. NPDC006706 TaxID=3364761 RepID=UPI00368762DD